MDGTLDEQQVCEWLAQCAFAVSEVKEIGSGKEQLKHIFTHIEWHMKCWYIRCENEGGNTDLTWVTAAQLEREIALPTAFKKVYRSACI